MNNATNILPADSQLSEHFLLTEFTRSATALRHRIDNTPSAEVVDNLRQLCLHVLEPLRRRFGVIRITSGYRSEPLNRLVGGARHSQHLRGEAADIHLSSESQACKMADYLRQHVDFDQCIVERRLRNGCIWLHVSYVAQPGRRANRREVLRLDC